ncbi:asparagine synthase-related protein [Streptomyces sp. NPDC004752]
MPARGGRGGSVRGLDSSSVVLLAARRRPVRAVTYASEPASTEDTAFAARVAAHGGLEQHVCQGGPRTWHFARPAPVAEDSPTLSTAIAGMAATHLEPAAGLGAQVTGGAPPTDARSCRRRCVPPPGGSRTYGPGSGTTGRHCGSTAPQPARRPSSTHRRTSGVSVPRHRGRPGEPSAARQRPSSPGRCSLPKGW